MNNNFTFKIYIKNRKKPIELNGLTSTQVDDFNATATSKMFVKYGPVLINSESIDYIIISSNAPVVKHNY